jgi:hypothetical protein
MSHRDRIAESILNAAEERMQERAQKEMESADPRWVDWLCNCYDISQVSSLISAALVVESVGWRNDSANEILSRECEWLRNDYYQYRASLADIDDLVAEIEEELNDVERDRQYEMEMLSGREDRFPA